MERLVRKNSINTRSPLKGGDDTRPPVIPAKAGISHLLIAIIGVGALLRFTSLNWDSFHAFHPDERNIAWAVTRIRFFSQMNPGFFAYSGLPIYLYRALGEIVAAIAHNPAWLSDWGHITVIGRYVSAVLSSLSILLIYQVGTAYFSSAVGLLSAFLLAFSPWAIREARFATTETMLVAFLLLLLQQANKTLAKPSYSSVLKMGILQGLAVAAKTTSAVFLLIPATAIWLSHGGYMSLKRRLFQKIVWSVVGVVVAACVFFVLSPYTILDRVRFMESMRYETGVVLGRFSVPYTLQFTATTPYVFQIMTMLWQAGPVAIIGIIGVITMLCLAILLTTRGDPPKSGQPQQEAQEGMILRALHLCWARRGDFFRAPSRPLWKWSMDALRLGLTDAQQKTSRDKRPHWEQPQRAPKNMLFLIFPIIYFFWTGNWFAKFARYNVLLLPFLTIAAAWLSVAVFQKIPHKSFYWIIGLLVYWIIGLFHVWWGLANWTIYLRPQTRIAASEWIYTNIPAGSLIYTEHWNDGLPVQLEHMPAKTYRRELLTVYDPDNDQKRDLYAEKLAQGDYIILSSPRIWRTMPRLGSKYPLTKLFYEKLLDGSLGYEEVSTFTSYPVLFGISLRDDTAEESIQVFDHPVVRIFRNVSKISAEELKEIFEAPRTESPRIPREGGLKAK